MKKELESEAENYVSLNWGNYKNNLSQVSEELTLGEISNKDFIAGATSKWVEKQKLQFAIEQLNKLDSVLQYKHEVLSNMQQKFLDEDGQLASKKSGLRLAKEEIRRDIKELEQQLSEL